MQSICNDCRRNGMDQCIFTLHWSKVKWCLANKIRPNEVDINYILDVDIQDVIDSPSSNTSMESLRKEEYANFIVLIQSMGAITYAPLPKCVTEGVLLLWMQP